MSLIKVSHFYRFLFSLASSRCSRQKDAPHFWVSPKMGARLSAILAFYPVCENRLRDAFRRPHREVREEGKLIHYLFVRRGVAKGLSKGFTQTMFSLRGLKKITSSRESAKWGWNPHFDSVPWTSLEPDSPFAKRKKG